MIPNIINQDFTWLGDGKPINVYSKMLTSIFHLRSYGFIHSYNGHLVVGYIKYLEGIKWEVVEDSLNDNYTVKRNGVVKYSSQDFKEVVKFLKDKKVI